MSASSLPLPEGKSDSLKQFISRHINVIGLLVVIAILYLVFAINAPGFISLSLSTSRPRTVLSLAAPLCVFRGSKWVPYRTFRWTRS
jgi:simple sugar transport system permease protein